MKKKFDSRQLVGQLLDKLEFSIGFESTLEVKSLRKKWIPTEEKFKGRFITLEISIFSIDI